MITGARPLVTVILALCSPCKQPPPLRLLYCVSGAIIIEYHMNKAGVYNQINRRDSHGTADGHLSSAYVVAQVGLLKVAITVAALL